MAMKIVVEQLLRKISSQGEASELVHRQVVEQPSLKILRVQLDTALELPISDTDN